jgi:hypothetical protein
MPWPGGEDKIGRPDQGKWQRPGLRPGRCSESQESHQWLDPGSFLMQHTIPGSRPRQPAGPDDRPEAILDAVLRASLERAVQQLEPPPAVWERIESQLSMRPRPAARCRDGVR